MQFLKNKQQFDWNSLNLVNLYKNLKLILVSRNEINVEHFEKIKEQIVLMELPPLSEEESADLVMNNCERSIEEELLNNKVPGSPPI